MRGARRAQNGKIKRRAFPRLLLAIGVFGSLALLGFAALGADASVASASTLTITVSPNPASIPPFDPLTGGGAVAPIVTLGGTYDGGSAYLDLYYQASQVDCAATTDAEKSIVDASAEGPNGGFESPINGGIVGQGPFTVTDQHTFVQPQVYRLCGYLTANTGGLDAGSPDATATALLTITQSASGGSPRPSSGVPTPGTSTTGAPARCIVPRLTGKTLPAANRALKAAGCRLGTIRRVHTKKSSRGRVIWQSPAPGRELSRGAKVAVRVGRA
jgi:hypothetical protein